MLSPILIHILNLIYLISCFPYFAISLVVSFFSCLHFLLLFVIVILLSQLSYCLHLGCLIVNLEFLTLYISTNIFSSFRIVSSGYSGWNRSVYRFDNNFFLSFFLIFVWLIEWQNLSVDSNLSIMTFSYSVALHRYTQLFKLFYVLFDLVFLILY